MVAATLLLLKRALSHPDRFDRFVLLSGSDYPLRSAESIERFFRTHREVEFINAAPLPNHLAGRLKKYRPESPRWLRASVRVLDTVGLAPRRDYGRVLGPLVPHKGSQWWALSREAVERVIRFEVEQPEVTKFFTCTHCPDETYFHTIIANTRPTLPLRPAVTFADWRRGGSSPAWLTMDHVAEIRRTHRFDSGNPGHPMLFVRKCPDPSDAVVTAIDEMISAKDGQTSS